MDREKERKRERYMFEDMIVIGHDNGRVKEKAIKI